MPVYEKNGRRTLFIHIPKTAGSSLHLWFARNGFSISNLWLIEDELKHCLQKESLPVELPISTPQHVSAISPQHALPEIWNQWGPFERKFAITRNPYSRYRSAIEYQYRKMLKKNNQAHSMSNLSIFRKECLRLIRENNILTTAFADNHFVPQNQFIDSSVKLYRYEENWPSEVANDFQLEGNLPRINSCDKNLTFLLNLGEKRFIRSFYQEDFQYFDYSLDPPP